MKRYLLSLLVTLLTLSGCQVGRKPAAMASATADAAAAKSPTQQAQFATSTPSAAELMAPYTLAGLRQHSFQSGAIRISKELDKSDVFTRYLISYGSDGLNINGIMQIPAQGHAPFPVIIMDHGFFDRREYRSGDGTDRAAEY